MIQIQGLWWPDDVQSKWIHAFKHVRSIEWAIARCQRRRTAVQAGGNVGLWPRRLAQSFERVITFEPDAISRECLAVNVPANVTVLPWAVGAGAGSCRLMRESLGSHRVVIEPGEIPVAPVDVLGLADCDLIQLDVEGYEHEALRGAYHTIMRCRPLIQVELRGFTERYGTSDAQLVAFLMACGYQEISRQPGDDVVFEVAP